MKIRPQFLPAAVVATSFALAASVASAQPTAEQLRASYDDVVRQLQQSQDRKNELANENEQLKSRLADLESRLATIEAQARQAAFLRQRYAALAGFVQGYPQLLRRFEALVNGNIGLANGDEAGRSAERAPAAFFDPHWPFSAATPDVGSNGATSVRREVIVRVPPATTSTTAPAAVTQGAAAHWCALCDSRAARKAEAGRSHGDSGMPDASADLMLDLLPR